MIHLLLITEIIIFLLASLTHRGVIIHGYEHSRAWIAEGIICLVLLTGLIFTLFSPGGLKTISLAVQGFALFGTFVGIFTITIGIGPRTIPDYILHAVLVILLVWGIIETQQIAL